MIRDISIRCHYWMGHWRAVVKALWIDEDHSEWIDVLEFDTSALPDHVSDPAGMISMLLARIQSRLD